MIYFLWQDVKRIAIVSFTNNFHCIDFKHASAILSIERDLFVTYLTCYFFPAGTTNRKSRSSVHSSRSASLSSVSNQNNRTLSAFSRDQEHFAPSPALDDSELDENSPTWPGMRDEFSRLQDGSAEDVDQNPTWQLSRDIASPSRESVICPSRDESVICTSRDSPVKSPSPPVRSPSVTSRVASPSTRSPSVQSRREKEAKSRASSAASFDANQQWGEAVKAIGVIEERKSSSSLRERTVESRQSDLNLAENDTRTASANSTNGGAETKATLGSEADMAQVSEVVVRSQSVLEGVYEDMLAEEETAFQEWPGVIEGVEVSEKEDMNESDDNDSITKGMFGQGELFSFL